MAFDLFRGLGALPCIAASQIGAGEAVKLVEGSSERKVVPLATDNVEPLGVALASAAGTYLGSGSGGFQLTTSCPVIDSPQVLRVEAGASLGVGADIGVASTNGVLAPVAGASGSKIWRVGRALTAAGAGEIFSLYVFPRQLSGEP